MTARDRLNRVLADLEILIQTAHDAVPQTPDLKDKVATRRAENDLRQARHNVRIHVFDLEDADRFLNRV
jgi:hypothetical protein